MGEVFKGGFIPHHIDTWENAVPEPGMISYKDAGHINELTVKIEQELMPMLETFLFQPASPAVIFQIGKTVDAYFATQWVVNQGINLIVDVNPWTGGIKVTAIINYGDDGALSEIDYDNVINFEVDHFIDYTMDEALEAALPDTDTSPAKEKDTNSVDDILFEPIDLEKQRAPKEPQPVHDDYGCYAND